MSSDRARLNWRWSQLLSLADPCVRDVIREGLDLLGVSAPEQM